MYGGKRIAVVIPAYNEEGFVGEVIDTVPEFVDRVYAIDDCSTDDTWAEIRARTDQSLSSTASGAEPADAKADGGTPAGRVVGVRHERNRGVGGAIKTGYKRALADEMDVVAVMNGDGQMDPDILDRFVGPVVNGDADYAKGNRLTTSTDRDGMSRWRFFGNVLLTILTKVASGYWKMNDPQNGYTAISRRALIELDIDSLYDRYGFCNDILVRLNGHRLTITDVRMEAVYGDEESDISYSSFVPRLSRVLFSDFLWRLKVRYVVTDFHPLVFLYLLGAVGTLSGLGYGIWALLAPDTHALTLPLVLLIGLVAGTVLAFAMIFDMLYNEPLDTDPHDRSDG